MPNSLLVYSSSAGSGKTFTLAKEFIKLLISNEKNFDPFYFRKILAVTFTKDAANEMKERILEYLEALAFADVNDEKKIKLRYSLLAILINELSEEGEKFTEEIIVNRAEIVFSTIIHHYSDFSVSTIDSFFQQIINAFAMQLGYSNNMEIILDSEELLLPAAERFISKVGTDTEKSLTNAIIEYTIQLADDGKTWQNLSKSFADFAKNLFSDSNLSYLDKIRDLSLESINVISLQLKDYQQHTEIKLKETAKRFVELTNANGLYAEDFLRGNAGGILSVFIKRANGIDLFKEFTATVLKVRGNEWYKKGSEKQSAIDAIKGELLDIFNEYDQLRETEKPKYNLFLAINKNLFKLSLLKQFQFEIEEIKSENGVVHISEFNKAILNVVANEPVPYIYERIGEKYNHIMIDEFQDTSPIQWQNFLPLISNSLSNGGSSMLVGDPKQAIYRFRGGDMNQIVHLYKKEIGYLKKSMDENSFLVDHLIEIEPYLTPKTLNINYRSAAEIIDFNNDLFNFIRNEEANLINKFPMLSKAFDDNFIQQKPLEVKTGGHVQIIFSDNSLKKELDAAANSLLNYDKKEELDGEAGENIAELEDPVILKLINECLEDRFEYGDMAILCRTNKNAKIIANYLKDNGIPIISSDSVLLSFSKSINFVISLMHVLANGGPLSRNQAIYLFHQAVLGDDMPEANDELKNLCENASINDYFNYFSTKGYQVNGVKLTTWSVYEMAENLIYAFRLLEQEKDQEYIFAFLDEILKFKMTKSDNLNDFLAYWEKNKSKFSIVASAVNAVTITSIHKAKGLQYPVVIVPEANWNMGFDNRSQIWVHLDHVEHEELTEKHTQNKLRVANLVRSAENENTEIKEQYLQEAERYFLEAINMLYVVLTRPEQRLYVITKFKEKADKKVKFLDKTTESEPKKTSINNIGELLHAYLLSKCLFDAETSNYILNEGLQKAGSNIVKNTNWEIVSASQYEQNNIAKLKISNSLDLIYNKYSIENGNKIHMVLSKIKYKADLETAMAKCLEEGLLNMDETLAIKEQIVVLINLPALSAFYADGLKIGNELDILLPNGKTKRPDRIVFYDNKTVIIDYKTGIEMPEHKSQIRNYGQLFIEMGYPAPELYLVYLENLKVILVD